MKLAQPFESLIMLANPVKFTMHDGSKSPLQSNVLMFRRIPVAPVMNSYALLYSVALCDDKKFSGRGLV